MSQAEAAIAKMNDGELQQHALEILGRELGVIGLARFLRTYKPGTVDYTRDRHKWLDGLTLDQIIEDVKRRREIAS